VGLLVVLYPSITPEQAGAVLLPRSSTDQPPADRTEPLP
jgi:hypothetical protein